MPEKYAYLWKQFVSGDEVAFKSLMQQYFKLLINYGARFSDDEELVKDATQELFISLWNRKDKLSVNVNPKAYLIASLRRALHRKIQFESRFVHDTESEGNTDYFKLRISVEENIINNEEIKRKASTIAEKIALLPHRQKEVIYLKYFESMSREEISNIMGISPQTVSNMLQLGLKKLRTELSRSILLFLTVLSSDPEC